MAFWSGESILEHSKTAPVFISDFSDARVDCNSYRLRMGDEYYCTSDARSNKSSTKKVLLARESFRIEPGQFGFLLSKESISVPANAMAFISMRAKMKFRGLINVSGFHVDPGYNGKLVFSVFNAGPSNVHLTEGEEMFLIWFAELDRNSTMVRKEAGYQTIPNDLINGMNKELASLYSLASDVASIRSNMRIQGIIFGVAVTFFFSILAGGVGFVLQNNLLSAILKKPTPAIELHVISGPPVPPQQSPPKTPSQLTIPPRK